MKTTTSKVEKIIENLLKELSALLPYNRVTQSVNRIGEKNEFIIEIETNYGGKVEFTLNFKQTIIEFKVINKSFNQEIPEVQYWNTISLNEKLQVTLLEQIKQYLISQKILQAERFVQRQEQPVKQKDIQN